MYLLDTNICIYAMKNRYPYLTDKLLTIHPDQIFISSVTIGELEYGIAKSKWGERTRIRMQMFMSAFAVIPFSQADAVVFGRLRAGLAALGTPIGPYDMMIAAQGVNRGLTVVPHNTAEFSRIPNLSIEDWAH
ncbi:MAG: type II toxin-antitoxin system VapC family toxin [Fretibacterium sp.]|nr:type II toxin-antitoxin system VapC family toxin [Fretibacterium sp.]